MTEIATLRNADLATLGDLLSMQAITKRDAVVDASAIVMTDVGQLFIEGLTDDVPMRCTEIFDEGLADKLKIPLKYVREMRRSRPDILAANVNGWLSGDPYAAVPDAGGGQYAIDDRKFTLRTYTAADATMPGVARAFLSDSYKRIDNWDAVVAVLDGINAAGVAAVVDRCQLTERRMSFTVVCPELGVNVSELLKDYRNPFAGDEPRAGGWTLERARVAAAREGGGYAPGKEPMLWAGFEAANSETGNGALTLCPRVVFSPCTNGLKLTRDVTRRMHLGERLDPGVFNNDTQEKNIELIKLMTRDSIMAWLDLDYLRAVVAELEQKDAPIVDATKSIEILAQQQAYSDETAAGILNHFIKGGQMSVLGLLNAVTSYAQVVDDADVAFDLENSAMAVLDGVYA